MKTQRIIEIAADFMKTMNPERWNGIGTKPESFNTKIKTYNIGSKDVQLDISFEFCEEEKAWEHYCELRNKSDGELLIPLHGYGVDSLQNLVNTIEDICSDYK